MYKKIICVAVLFSISFSLSAHGDTVYLKNGNKVSGIITKEGEREVEIRINIGAVVTFSRLDIEKIEKESDEKRARMEEDWGTEREKKLIGKAPEGTSESSLREEGLVEYEGEWVSPEEKERLQASSAARDAERGFSDKRVSAEKGSRDKSIFANRLLTGREWFIRETEHFSIFYTDSSQAKLVSDKAEYYFEKISYDLGYEGKLRWEKKCRVYIVESVDAWKRFLKDIGFNPDLVGGFVPNYEEREMFLCALSDPYLALTFPHELTHLIFRGIAGESTIPLWLNEGLANYEASLTSISNELLVKRIKQGRHILLGDLVRMSGYPEGKETRELFYAQSEKLVEFFITQYGRKKFNKFYEMILGDRSFKDAVFSVYKADFKDLEDFNIQLVEYIVK